MILQLPDRLKTTAYASQTGEFAWPRQDAVSVIDLATQSNVAVFGVEVWLPTTPGPTIPSPIFYEYAPEERPGEPWEGFVRRANSEAREYVAQFQWDDADDAHKTETPFFNLTLGDQ